MYGLELLSKEAYSGFYLPHKLLETYFKKICLYCSYFDMYLEFTKYTLFVSQHEKGIIKIELFKEHIYQGNVLKNLFDTSYDISIVHNGSEELLHTIAKEPFPFENEYFDFQKKQDRFEMFLIGI